MKHVLIDFENLQPEQLDEWAKPHLNIWLFIGAHQKKMDISLSESLCRLQEVVKNIHFIHIQQAGKNALDFCLAYYIGRITIEDDNADIVILSKDAGYDSLIRQVRHEQTAKQITRYHKGLVLTKLAAPKTNKPEVNIPIHAFKTILSALVNYPSKLPNELDKFKKILKHLVKKELGIKDKEQYKHIARHLQERLAHHHFLQIQDQKVLFLLSRKDFEKRLLADITQHHPRTLSALYHTIEQHIDTKTNLDYSEKMANDIIALLERQNVLQKNGSRLHYPSLDGQLENQPEALSQHAQRVIKILHKSQTTSLPKKEAALKQSLRSWLGKSTKEAFLKQLIIELINFNYLVIANNGMVTYQLKK